MVIVPIPAIVVMPGLPAVTDTGGLAPKVKLLMVSGPPSTSVALLSKPPGSVANTVSGVFCVTLLLSLPSTGASFTGVTVIA